MDYDKAKKMIDDADIRIECPNEGEDAACAALKEGKPLLAAACFIMASACSLGHKRSQWYEDQAKKCEKEAERKN